MKAAPWNDQENRALVALYFVMLDAATSGQSYNKAAMIREQQQDAENAYTLDDCPLMYRSRGSIEAKLMKASAAHCDLRPESETMATHGYKAWGNYQAALKASMLTSIELREQQARMSA